jgi:hypothetical protein
MSCVHRAMTRDVGVMSSHLQNVEQKYIVEIQDTYLSVVPSTDSMSFLWIVRDARIEPL